MSGPATMLASYYYYLIAAGLPICVFRQPASIVVVVVLTLTHRYNAVRGHCPVLYPRGIHSRDQPK